MSLNSCSSFKLKLLLYSGPNLSAHDRCIQSLDPNDESVSWASDSKFVIINRYFLQHRLVFDCE